MSQQIVMRPIYNRPEMLKLSIEYEIAAREYFKPLDDILTVFVVEHGSPEKVIEVMKSYPYKAAVIQRKQKLGLTINILEGMRQCFDLTDSFLIHLEDDVLLHKTYFQYIYTALNSVEVLKGPFSIISAYNFTDGDNPSDVYLGHHYAALAPVINKQIWEKYMKFLACESYYKNPPSFVIALNEHYKAHWGDKYKYTNHAHFEQAGLWNRIVDIALIEDNMHVLMPKINRQQHIGYYGKNRPGGVIPGNSFDERFENLKQIIMDANDMYKRSATPQYNDYKTFSPLLDNWNGELKLI